MAVIIEDIIINKLMSSSGKKEDVFKLIVLNQEILSIDNFIKEIPVYPEWREKLKKEDLVRAIHGTLAIEGADVQVERVEQAVEEQKEEPADSRQAEKEIRNMLKAYDFIDSWSVDNKDQPITENLVRQLHTIITRDISYYLNKEGEYRNIPVSFGTPRKEGKLKNQFQIQEGMKTLIKTIHEEGNDDYLESLPIIKALYAHYLITLIHPFADGNGRVARAVEALVLRHIGGFGPHFFCTADFYYKNRLEYFKALRESDEQQIPIPFMIFAMTGLMEHLKTIKKNLLDKITESMIMDYAGELLEKKKIVARQLNLLAIMFPLGKKISITELWAMPAIKGLYLKLTDRTRRRDILRLTDLDVNLLTLYKEEGRDLQIAVNWDVLAGVTLRLDKVPHRPED